MSDSARVLATLNLVLGGLVFLLGLVILRENRRQRLNRVVSLLLFFGGFGAVLAALSLLLPEGRTVLPDEFAYLWELFFPTAFLFAAIFPVERPFARPFVLFGRWRSPGFTALVYTPHIFHFVLLFLVNVGHPDRASFVGVPSVLKPLIGLFGVLGGVFLSVHRSLFSLVDIGFGAGAIALLLGAWRSTTVARLRRQLGAIAVGLAGCLAFYAAATSIPTLVGHPLARPQQAMLTTVALLLGSGAIAYAMVRHKFLDTKLIARRGILYALASAVLIGVYLLAVERVNRFLAGAIGLDARVVEPVLLIMALTIFQPVIARLEEMLDQMFLRDPSDYRNVIRRLGRELQTTIDLDDLLARSVRTLTDTLLLRTAYVIARTREGPVGRVGAGPDLEPASLAALVELGPRLPAGDVSFRLSEPIDGLRRLDRELLQHRLGIEIVVPLRWRDETLGLMLLGDKLTGTEFTREEVDLLNTLGGQMGVSLQNALLLRDRLRTARIEEELNLAQQIQRTFLRTDFPAMPRCEVYAINLPSRQVGGDYYDVVPRPDGSFLVAIADVAGKGVPAALLSSMLQAALRTQARSGEPVNVILRNINALVYRSTAVHQFATFFLGHVDPQGRRLSFTNAGHNWPLLLRRNGRREFLQCGGLLLGVVEDVTLELDTVELESGDVLVLYTDGISEATNSEGDLFGEDRIIDLVAGLPEEVDARGVADSLLRAVEHHLAGIEAQDDRTLVIVRVQEPAGERAALTDPGVALATE